ncbi:MAG: hypothetical protein K8S23_10500 [Candidatus Cloacimonetes bacterium]|nr:hypothetical protein [Candidatus Cloacimonadota bacterium]
MERSIKKKKLNIALKALSAAIPFIGGSINSVFSDIVAQRKEERFIELVTSLESEINKIKIINKAFITHEDFLDLFENISKHVVNERDATKRIMYKNIILSSVKDSKANFDKTEKYIRLLENIITNDIIILKIFLNPMNFNKEIGNPIINKNEGNSNFTYLENVTVLELLKKLLPDITSEDILDSLDFLERNRLIVTHNGKDSLKTNGNPIHLLDNKTTIKGTNFIKYIINENY